MRVNWKSIIGSVAPTLATALGGPFAGMATRAISAAVLGKPDGKEKELEAALEMADPEVFERIKKADQEFEAEMKRLDVNLEDIAHKDRLSARLREQLVGGKANPILAGIIIAGFLIMVWYVLTKGLNAEMDPGMAALAGTLIGYVSAKADQVVSYYFGSSAGSKEKTNVFEKMLVK